MTAVDGAIVVGVDGTEESIPALRWAAEEAALRNASLHLVYGFAPLAAYEGAGLPVLHNAFAEMEHAGRVFLEDASRQVPGGVPVTTQMRPDPPVPLLLELSGRARMIVLGSAGSRGFVGVLLGSTAVSVATHARCPVVVVRGNSAGGPVVVGVEGSRASEPAIAAAFDEAAWRKAPLVAVHAFSAAEHAIGRRAGHEDERVVLARSLAGWQEKYPDVRVDRITAVDRPRHQLLDLSQRARLVVVGSHGRGELRGLLLGSISQGLVNHAGCPVMVVRPEAL